MQYGSNDWSKLLRHDQDAISESVEVVLVPEVLAGGYELAPGCPS